MPKVRLARHGASVGRQAQRSEVGGARRVGRLIDDSKARALSAADPARTERAFTPEPISTQVTPSSGNETRTCTAPGIVRYVAGTANGWTIQVKRGTIIVQTLSGGSYASTVGTLSSRKGDTIVITLRPTCTQYSCVVGGFIAVGDQV